MPRLPLKAAVKAATIGLWPGKDAESVKALKAQLAQANDRISRLHTDVDRIAKQLRGALDGAAKSDRQRVHLVTQLAEMLERNDALTVENQTLAGERNKALAEARQDRANAQAATARQCAMEARINAEVDVWAKPKVTPGPPSWISNPPTYRLGDGTIIAGPGSVIAANEPADDKAVA